MKKILFIVITACFIFPFAEKADAQWAIGASYEVRSEDPTNGFGLRLEREILSSVPVVEFNMRAHFSYFSETNEATTAGVSVSRDFEAYDYGLALSAGLGLAFVKPYVGLGIGSETFDFSSDNGSFNETNFYWNGFGGIELDVLPNFKPFLEYRIARLEGTEDISFDNVGRLAVGLNVRF